MKFVCDSMLKKLGKFLRVLGYNTIIVESKIKDEEILEIAMRENRYLISRDKDFNRFKKIYDKIIILESNELRGQILELNEKLGNRLDLTPKAKRCILCNGELEVLEDKRKLVGKIPEGVLKRYKRFYVCKNCGQIYWEGSKWDKIVRFINSLKGD